MRVAVDSGGNTYIADYSNHAIRKVTSNGTISTIAGMGIAGYSGDGGAATSALLNYPLGLAFDSSNNLYIADSGNNVVRRITSAGVISTVAGTGTAGNGAPGGLATTTNLNGPSGVAIDGSGNLYIADTNNNLIRKVDLSTGILTTFAGNGASAFSGDGGPAINASFNKPQGIFIDSSGNLFVADTSNHSVRKIAASAGTVSTVAGNGTYGSGGDNGLATGAVLSGPTDVVTDSSGDLFIADPSNSVIRKVTASSGDITTVAGSGVSGYSGNGQSATAAQLDQPSGIVFLNGSLLIADSANNEIRVVKF
ncbi:MAG TPA: NHL repeat-containing protein [Candidatus Acidoferrales bacterium]|nr:NHL repeat-containing protein [Candidatus Acidoferrales bacterium]